MPKADADGAERAVEWKRNGKGNEKDKRMKKTERTKWPRSAYVRILIVSSLSGAFLVDSSQIQ
jgi:hypothetical protein